MRRRTLNIPLKNSPHTIFPKSQLTILIKIERSTTNHLPPRPKCLQPIALPTTTRAHHPQRRNTPLPLSPNPRRTIGQRSQTLRREDAFKIALHRENSVHLPTRFCERVFED